ncbi:flagellar filament capping protein FliD [Candidatus Contendibacter odensensis]|uniref:Flagellar hook-associated protein 2 n=1 Tax=Candidatus Contendobacter odensis Run_B_J11 TaxID=1400861 RepID=A0A7U7J1W4_9GAMM|nr:flagellar filament capping protein FliD [Candidatus Contendobacter odensis]CDH44158.1 putative Flagellar hook-associated protein fliD [Candidatus Contendobacter odensis Run_B_J11]
MASITSSGLRSNLDINSIVSQLISAERTPTQNRLNRKEATLQAQISGFGTVKSALSALERANTVLTATNTFMGIKATPGNSNLLTATALSSAPIGSYNIEVSQRAQGQTLASGTFSAVSSTVGTGTLTIEFGQYTGGDPQGLPPTPPTGFNPNADKSSLTLTIDDSNKTLEGIRDAINTAKKGVTASIINDGSTGGGYRLMLSSDDPGLKNSLKITAGGGDGGLASIAYDPTTGVNNLTETVAAQDAQIKVNGLSITSSSNTLSSAIAGVTLTLQDKGSTTLNLSRDTAAATNAVEGFVKAYNSILETVNKLSFYNAETGEKGALLGDAALRSINAQMRRILGDGVSGDSTFRTLSSVGVTLERDNTTKLDILKLDSSKLQQALGTDAAGVSKLFAGSGSGDTRVEGLSSRLNTFLDATLSRTGTLQGKTDSFNARLKDITGQRSALDQRMAKVEARYLAQFRAMDAIVGKMTSTGNYLTQQLAGLSAFYTNQS